MASVIASATAVFPDAVGPKSASTSGASGGDERLPGAAKRRRRRSGDLNRHELAGIARPVEVHGRVASRSPAPESGVGPARPFDEHLLDPTDAQGVSLRGEPLDELDELLDAARA